MVTASGGMSVKACYHSRLRPARFCADSHQIARSAGLLFSPATGDNAGASATNASPGGPVQIPDHQSFTAFALATKTTRCEVTAWTAANGPVELHAAGEVPCA